MNLRTGGREKRRGGMRHARKCIYPLRNVLQISAFEALRKGAVSGMMSMKKKKEPLGRYFFTVKRNNRLPVKVGRLFLFYGNNVASDENKN